MAGRKGQFARLATAIALVTATFAFQAPAAHAAEIRVWTGAAGDLWSDPNNWSPTGAPSDGDTVVFSGNVGTTRNDIPKLTIAAIGRSGTGQARIEALNGANELTLTGGILASSSLVVGMNLTLSPGQHPIGVGAGAHVGLAGVNGPGGITKVGPGDMSVLDFYTGTTLVDAGVLSKLDFPGQVPPSSVSVASGATLELGPFGTDDGITIAGDGAPGRAGALVLSGGTVTGRLTLAGPARVASEPLQGGALGGGVSGTGPLRLVSNLMRLNAPADYTGGTIIEGSVVIDSPTALGTGIVTIEPAGALTFGEGVDVPNDVVVHVASGAADTAIYAFGTSAVFGSVTFTTPGGAASGADRAIEVAPDMAFLVGGGIHGNAPARKSGPGALWLAGDVPSQLSATFSVDEGLVLHLSENASVLPRNTVVGPEALVDLLGTDVVLASIVVHGALYLGIAVPGEAPDASVLTTSVLDIRPGAVLGTLARGTRAGVDIDRIVASSVSVDGAHLDLDVASGFAPGTTLRIVDNIGSAAIAGRFVGFSEGSAHVLADQAFLPSYVGGSGNDFTLTRPGGQSLPVVAQGSPSDGYWMVDRAGAVYAFGGVPYLGRVSNINDVVDLEPNASGRGYWIVTAGGFVFGFGDVALHGHPLGQLASGEQVVSMSATPSGTGYWIFTNQGRVFAFGAARFMGDMSGTVLNSPVLDSVSTPTGDGYYMVAADGGVFAFGDARFFGSMGGRPLNAPVMSLVPDADNHGYWLVALDGGVFAFDAPFRGSMGGTRLNRSVIGMVRFGNGYLMVGEDGGIFNFSDKPFFGSLGASPPSAPVVAVASFG